MDNQQIKSYDEEENEYQGLWTYYHIRLIRGAYNELLQYPPMKEYIINSSALEDGVRYDIPANGIKFDKKDFSIQCVLDTTNVPAVQDESRTAVHLRAFDDFIEKISEKPFDLKILSLGRVFRLVYTGHERNRKLSENISTFTLSITEPNPRNRS